MYKIPATNGEIAEARVKGSVMRGAKPLTPIIAVVIASLIMMSLAFQSHAHEALLRYEIDPKEVVKNLLPQKGELRGVSYGAEVTGEYYDVREYILDPDRGVLIPLESPYSKEPIPSKGVKVFVGVYTMHFGRSYRAEYKAVCKDKQSGKIYHTQVGYLRSAFKGGVYVDLYLLPYDTNGVEARHFKKLFDLMKEKEKKMLEAYRQREVIRRYGPSHEYLKDKCPNDYCIFIENDREFVGIFYRSFVRRGSKFVKGYIDHKYRAHVDPYIVRLVFLDNVIVKVTVNIEFKKEGIPEIDNWIMENEDCEVAIKGEVVDRGPKKVNELEEVVLGSIKPYIDRVRAQKPSAGIITETATQTKKRTGITTSTLDSVSIERVALTLSKSRPLKLLLSVEGFYELVSSTEGELLIYLGGSVVARRGVTKGSGSYDFKAIKVELSKTAVPGSEVLVEVRLVAGREREVVATDSMHIEFPITDSVVILRTNPSPDEKILPVSDITFRAHLQYYLGSRSGGILRLLLKYETELGTKGELIRGPPVKVSRGFGEALLELKTKIPRTINGMRIAKLYLYAALWPEGAKKTSIFDFVEYTVSKGLALQLLVETYAAKDRDLVLTAPLTRSYMKSIGVTFSIEVYAVGPGNALRKVPYTLDSDGVLNLADAVVALKSDEYVLVSIDSEVLSSDYERIYGTKRFFPPVKIPLIPVRDSDGNVKGFRVILRARSAKQRQYLLLRNCFIDRVNAVLFGDPRIKTYKSVVLPADEVIKIRIRSIPVWTNRLIYAMYSFLKEAGVKNYVLSSLLRVPYYFGKKESHYVIPNYFNSLGYIEYVQTADQLFDIGDLDIIGFLHEFGHAVRQFSYPDKVLDERAEGSHDRYAKASTKELAYDEAHSHFFSMLVVDYAISKGLIEKELHPTIKRRDSDYRSFFGGATMMSLKSGDGSWIEGVIASFLFRALYIGGVQTGIPNAEETVKAYRTFYRACNLHREIFGHYPRTIDELSPVLAVLTGSMNGVNRVISEGRRRRIEYFENTKIPYPMRCRGSPCIPTLVYVHEIAMRKAAEVHYEGNKLVVRPGSGIPLIMGGQMRMSVLFDDMSTGVVMVTPSGRPGVILRFAELSILFGRSSVVIRGSTVELKSGRVYMKVTEEGKKSYGVMLVAGKSFTIKPHCTLEAEVANSTARLYMIEGEAEVKTPRGSLKVSKGRGIVVDLNTSKVMSDEYTPEEFWWDSSPPALTFAEAPSSAEPGEVFNVAIGVEDDSPIQTPILVVIGGKEEIVGYAEPTESQGGVYRYAISIKREGLYLLAVYLNDTLGNDAVEPIGYILVSESSGEEAGGSGRTTAITTTSANIGESTSSVSGGTATGRSTTSWIEPTATSAEQPSTPVSTPRALKRISTATRTEPDTLSTIAGAMFLLLIVVGVALGIARLRRRRG